MNEEKVPNASWASGISGEENVMPMTRADNGKRVTILKVYIKTVGSKHGHAAVPQKKKSYGAQSSSKEKRW